MIAVALGGIVIALREEHLANAKSSIEVTDPGI